MLGGAATITLIVAGCATSATVEGDTASPPADTAAAREAVVALEAPVNFTDPGEAFEVGTALEGKTIAAIVSGQSAAFVQDFVAGLEDAADVLGASVDVQDSQYDSTKAAELIDKAVASGAAAIITQSVDSTAVAASLGAAADAGIPVVEATSRDAGAVPAEVADLGVAAISSFCYTCAGTQMADYAVASTDGDVHALLFSVPGVVVSDAMVEGFESRLAELSAGSTVTVVEAPAADWESSLATLTTSNLQTNPNINWLVPVFDAMVGLIEPAIAASGMSNVSIVTYNASGSALSMVADGSIVKADVGGSPYWLGWASVDQAARVVSGADAVDDVAVPHRIFNENNIADIDLAQQQQTWYGDVDIAAEYQRLWGLG